MVIQRGEMGEEMKTKKIVVGIDYDKLLKKAKIKFEAEAMEILIEHMRRNLVYRFGKEYNVAFRKFFRESIKPQLREELEKSKKEVMKEIHKDFKNKLHKLFSGLDLFKLKL